jgi:excisionase family DNA binding protein
MNNNEYMTVREFAGRMRVSVSTVWRWVRSGMPVVRGGGKGGVVRVKVEEAECWLRGGGDD